MGIIVVNYENTHPNQVINKMVSEHASKFNGGPYKAPVLFIVTNDLSKPIATISMKELSDDARTKARELITKIKNGEINVSGGDGGQPDKKEEMADAAKKESDDSKTEKELLLTSQDWINDEGVKITAGVVKIDGGQVVFRMANGKDLPYDISKLSADSREKLKALISSASE
ncbi:MAG: hypothetical protein ACJAQT_005310 [Akkermansiaceae bacterium]